MDLIGERPQQEFYKRCRQLDLHWSAVPSSLLCVLFSIDFIFGASAKEFDKKGSTANQHPST